ncbi:hypothetical protein GCM10010106_19250 [Thermopolyspora flexuosa]|jgi:hypothetical protein|uniref:Uncharacterized protein n=1 Tax=Thermopolyspora flexuosa TaxID=103836 RepID=A0A543J3T3_9ACTN|nr:hypothetical protein [Thermopolyspora flexuosa]TQM77489.1 hypothetical protein FHX40_4254 [Thermopolyspora flexuosa]GGM72984.1 hypothetical protein GCM10010106_19250 [Thermopolyspora flexuosa]
MDPDTYRGDAGLPDPDVYWRRRVSVLTALLIVVAAVVWACTRTSGESAEAGPGSATAGPSALVASPAAGGAPDGVAGPSPTPRAERRSGDARCAEEDIVVHLEGLQEVYPPGVRPRFVVMLVNTGEEPCVLDVGPRALDLRITSGSDRVWSSADCVGGEEATKLHRLERGVPFVRSISWNRHRSGRDCSASHPEAKAGTYVATAVAGSLTSEKTVFHLR